MIDDFQDFFLIFRPFSFNGKKLKSISNRCVSICHIDAPFCRKSVCFAGNQSVYGGFQGAARICLTFILDSSNFVEKRQRTYKHDVNKINETDNS